METVILEPIAFSNVWELLWCIGTCLAVTALSYTIVYIAGKNRKVET